MVKWTTPAKQDLRSIHDYIALDSKFYARRVTIEITEKSEKLGLFPEVGRVLSELGDPNLREIFIYSYRLIYEVVAADTIVVLAVIHSKRDFMNQLDDLGRRRADK